MSKDVEAPVTEAPVTEAPVKNAAEKRVKIRIPSDDSDMGRTDVSVGWNGDVIRIKRDAVVVKVGHYNALMDATKTEYDVDADGRIIGEHKVPRYNVQRLD